MKKNIIQYYINARAFRPEISENDFNYFYSQMKVKCADLKDFTVTEHKKTCEYKDGTCIITTYTLVDACGYSYFELIKVTRVYK